MPDEADSSKTGQSGSVVRFPQSRVTPPGANAPFKDLGLSALCKKLGLPERQTMGHWCSYCEGIWYGYLLEVDCPICGNRHG